MIDLEYYRTVLETQLHDREILMNEFSDLIKEVEDEQRLAADIFDRTVKWNIQRDNTKFNHDLETKMLAEELYEFCLQSRSQAKASGKEFSRLYSPLPARANSIAISSKEHDDLIDAAGDLIFIAIGTIYKLGANPKEVLRRICDANDKKGSKKDADGKIIKSADFIEPVHVA